MTTTVTVTLSKEDLEEAVKNKAEALLNNDFKSESVIIEHNKVTVTLVKKSNQHSYYDR